MNSKLPPTSTSPSDNIVLEGENKGLWGSLAGLIKRSLVLEGEYQHFGGL